MSIFLKAERANNLREYKNSSRVQLEQCSSILGVLVMLLMAQVVSAGLPHATSQLHTHTHTAALCFLFLSHMFPSVLMIVHKNTFCHLF